MPRADKDNKMAAIRSLLNIIGTGVLATFVGVSLIKSCQDNLHDSKPGITYFVHGKEVMDRRFETNEECQKYLNSEQGKKEAEYYSRLNAK